MLSEKAFNALPEDAGGAAAARQVHLRDHRDPQGAGDDPVALPALRPAPHRRRAAGRAPRRDLRAGKASTVEPEALAMIARAAEGSARDSLSLLDQAIAHGAGRDRRRDRARHARPRRPRPRDRPLRGGDARRRRGGAARSCATSTIPGADPAGRAHRPRRVHPSRDAAQDRARRGGRGDASPKSERVRGQACATLPMRVLLARLADAVARASSRCSPRPSPLAAAEMVLVRLAYAADLPTPDEALRLLAAERRRGRRCAVLGWIVAVDLGRRDRAHRSGSSAAGAGRVERRASRFGAARACRHGPGRPARPVHRHALRAAGRGLPRAQRRAGDEDRALRGSGGAGDREARHQDADGAGARRAGWCASRMGGWSSTPPKARRRSSRPTSPSGSASGPAGAGSSPSPRRRARRRSAIRPTPKSATG